MDTICFYICRKFRFHKKHKNSGSSLSPSSPSYSSLCHNWLHPVFLSFCGEDVRKGFLSHIHKEFQRNGITPFIDNEIKRGASIGPELLRAIRGSKIAVILFSRNYGSSKWCIDELVEIMKCREELGQTVMTIFYDVDPSDVRKQKGDFGKAFRKTCVGKPEEVKQKWRLALISAANILGEDSRSWENEADMITKISKDVSDVLSFTPSKDFDEFVGIEAHVTEINSLLQLDLDEVRMIRIWGPAGIGKTTISRVLYNKLFHQFQLSTIMDNIKVHYPRPCHDEYSAKLQLQKELLSKLINQKDIVVPHLGVAQERLRDKKVLLVLDDVDGLVQLDAMAKDIHWFGLGSRIIVVTEDQKLLKAHGIKYIYKVDYPTSDEALQIFCMYAFGQKFPKVGFEKIAQRVTTLAGKLPLGIRLMGSYLRRMSKREWAKTLPRFYNSLDEEEKALLAWRVKDVCATCFGPAETRCARCKSVRYCSGKCQIIHWRLAHRDECVSVETCSSSAERVYFEKDSSLHDPGMDSTMYSNNNKHAAKKTSKSSVEFVSVGKGNSSSKSNLESSRGDGAIMFDSNKSRIKRIFDMYFTNS